MSDLTLSEIRAEPDECGRVGDVARLLGHADQVVTVTVGGEQVELPGSLVRLLVAGADAMEDGESVTVVSTDAEVSPAEAAELLGVSRQYVDRLVTNGVLPVRRLPRSRYRKIPVRAVLAHRATKAEKQGGIASIVELAEQAGLPY